VNKYVWLLAQRPGKLGASAALSAVYMFNPYRTNVENRVSS